MEDNINNRMEEGPRKRGRPTNAEISARMPPVEEPGPGGITPEADSASLPREGMKCPHCGRLQYPRITTTHGLTRYVSCSLCGGRSRMDYAADFRTKVVQKL